MSIISSRVVFYPTYKVRLLASDSIFRSFPRVLRIGLGLRGVVVCRGEEGG